MKLIVVFIALTACALASEDQDNESKKYTDKFDKLDLDAILENKRLLAAYCKCVLDQGKCTAEGRELKSHVNEALQNGCKRCTHAQREGMRRVIKHFIVNDPDTWEQLVEKYDPNRVYTTKYEKELKNMED